MMLKRARRRARQPVAEQRREPEVREAALERIEEQVVALARARCARSATRARRAARTSGAAARAAAAPAAARATRSRRASRRAISSRVRSASSVDSGILAPAQRGTIAACRGAGFTYAVISRDAHELEHAAGEHEAVAGREPRDERLPRRGRACGRCGYCTVMLASLHDGADLTCVAARDRARRARARRRRRRSRRGGTRDRR